MIYLGRQAPPLPKPQRPKKPDPAARRMKPLDYVALMFGIDPPPPDANLPPPIGYRFPELPTPEQGYLPPPINAVPPAAFSPVPRGGPASYNHHVLRMRGKMGF